MPQLTSFYFFYFISTFAIIAITVYILSKYISPKFVRIFIRIKSKFNRKNIFLCIMLGLYAIISRHFLYYYFQFDYIQEILLLTFPGVLYAMHVPVVRLIILGLIEEFFPNKQSFNYLGSKNHLPNNIKYIAPAGNYKKTDTIGSNSNVSNNPGSSNTRATVPSNKPVLAEKVPIGKAGHLVTVQPKPSKDGRYTWDMLSSLQKALKNVKNTNLPDNLNSIYGSNLKNLGDNSFSARREEVELKKRDILSRKKTMLFDLEELEANKGKGKGVAMDTKEISDLKLEIMELESQLNKPKVNPASIQLPGQDEYNSLEGKKKVLKQMEWNRNLYKEQTKKFEQYLADAQSKDIKGTFDKESEVLWKAYLEVLPRLIDIQSDMAKNTKIEIRNEEKAQGIVSSMKKRERFKQFFEKLVNKFRKNK